MSVDISNLNHGQLEQLIADAKKQQSSLLRERRDEVKRKLIQMAKDEGYSIEELFGGKAASRSTKGSKVAPKFRNPADPSQTWTGRGKSPRWYADAIASGKKESDLLI